jgi:hypothetical protein
MRVVNLMLVALAVVSLACVLVLVVAGTWKLLTMWL